MLEENSFTKMAPFASHDLPRVFSTANVLPGLGIGDERLGDTKLRQAHRWTNTVTHWLTALQATRIEPSWQTWCILRPPKVPLGTVGCRPVLTPGSGNRKSMEILAPFGPLGRSRTCSTGAFACNKFSIPVQWFWSRCFLLCEYRKC